MIGISESESLLRRARAEHPEFDLRVIETSQELTATVLNMLHELKLNSQPGLPLSTVLGTLHADFYVRQAARRHLEALTMLLGSVMHSDEPSTSKEV